MPRSNPASPNYEFGPFRLLTGERSLLRNGEAVTLTTRAFDTLLLLVQHRGEMLGKDAIIRSVWPDTVVSDNSLVQIVSSLRKALGEGPHEHKFIETNPGQGYRFVGQVRELRDEERKADKQAAPDQSPRDVGALRSIAVLPFKPLGSERGDEYLELGMADALITRLSNISQLIVRPTSAVWKHADSGQQPVPAGRKLRVDAVLEGTVQRWGERLRVTVQLVRVCDGAALWAARFDEQFTNIFEVQDAISEQVMNALLLELSGAEKRLLAKRPTENTEAHRAYLKGRYCLERRSDEAIKKAAAHFQQAIDLDPGYALAHTGLADTYNLAGMLYNRPPKETFPKAKAAALRALALDDQLAEAHTSLAVSRLYYDWDLPAAERDFLKAIELNPNYATAHLWYGWLLSAQGAFEGALDELRRALELDPLSLVAGTTTGAVLYFARRYDEAIAQFQQTLEMDSGFALTHHCLSLVYTKQSKFIEAISAASRAVTLSEHHPRMLSALGCVQALAGNTAEARRTLDQLVEAGTQRYVSPYFLATLHAALGQNEQALSLLEQAFAERSGNLFWVAALPALDGLREDARFSALLEGRSRDCDP